MQTAITRTSGPGRVLLVDDHPAVRRVLRSLLEEVGGWQVVGEADSGEAAIPLVEQLAPDVVLMDCRMPGAGGVAATREIVNRWPEVAVVAHTAYADETYVREMVAAGARGYVLKGDVPAAVLEALSAARQGQARLSAAVVEDLRELYEAAVSRSKELEAENADLSSTVARLEEVDRLKDEFLAMVSHELRTPITVVLGMAQTLVGRPDMAATADGQEILQRVVRQGKRLRDMVEQLLQASAFVANRSPVLRARRSGPPTWSPTGGWPSPTAGSSCSCPSSPARCTATPRRCGWWSATWSTTPASTPRPAPRSASWSASHGA
jgi:DNA-binding NarL/FixJ family response regulator